jgi:hypothetical protein
MNAKESKGSTYCLLAAGVFWGRDALVAWVETALKPLRDEHATYQIRRKGGKEEDVGEEKKTGKKDGGDGKDETGKWSSDVGSALVALQGRVQSRTVARRARNLVRP